VASLCNLVIVYTQPHEGVYNTLPTEKIEILLEEEEAVEDDEFSSEEEVGKDETDKPPTEVTSPKIPLKTKEESTDSLGFSKELSFILASKMNTLNDDRAENVPSRDKPTSEKETSTKETDKAQQRRKPPLPPAKPKV